MTISFSFDAERFREEVLQKNQVFTSEILQDLALTTTMAVYDRWLELAEGLTSSREAYVRSLQPPEISKHAFDAEGVVRLAPAKVDRWIIFLEEGGPAWDMKPMLLGGNERVVIPFAQRQRSANPAKEGGMPIGTLDVHRGYRARVGMVIGAAASRLRGQESLGVRDVERGAGFPIPKLRSQTGYTHQTSIYEGLRRQTTKQARAKRGERKGGKYFTMRTISAEGSDPDSWWYPAQTGLHFADRAAEVAEPVAKQYVSDVVAGLKRVRRAAVAKAPAIRGRRK